MPAATSEEGRVEVFFGPARSSGEEGSQAPLEQSPAWCRPYPAVIRGIAICPIRAGARAGTRRVVGTGVARRRGSPPRQGPAGCPDGSCLPRAPTTVRLVAPRLAARHTTSPDAVRRPPPADGAGGRAGPGSRVVSIPVTPLATRTIHESSGRELATGAASRTRSCRRSATPAVLVGCSVGAMVAQHLYHLRPERTAAVVLTGARWSPTKPHLDPGPGDLDVHRAPAGAGDVHHGQLGSARRSPPVIARSRAGPPRRSGTRSTGAPSGTSSRWCPSGGGAPGSSVALRRRRCARCATGWPWDRSSRCLSRFGPGPFSAARPSRSRHRGHEAPPSRRCDRGSR